MRQCSGNPSCSFDIDESIQHATASTEAPHSDLVLKKKKKRFHFKFKRTKHLTDPPKNESSTSSTDSGSYSMTNKLHSTTNLNAKTENSIMFNTPVSSVKSDLSDSSNSYVNDLNALMFSSELEFSTNNNESKLNQCLGESNMQTPGAHSMLTYNTKYANNSEFGDEEDARVITDEEEVNISENLQQSTPFNELGNPTRLVRNDKRKSSHMCNENFKKSKTTNFQNLLKFEENSPMVIKQNRKCRRSNTTFTMMGSQRNKIIDYFNNLEMTKSVRGHKNVFISHQDMNTIGLRSDVFHDEEELNDSKPVNESKTELDQTKDEIEKIQDLFFHDDSYMSGDRAAAMVAEVNLSTDKNMLTTFMDSPVSVNTSDKTSAERSHPVCSFISNKESNSTERFRRSFSMPVCMNEPNLSIFANSSKLNSYHLNCDEEAMVTPKKELKFDQPAENVDKSIENLTDHSAFEISPGDDMLPRPFVRGQQQSRLSKNIKQMFKNVVKLQMNALNNLEKFYEAQLLKVEADRQQNLKFNPENSEKINEFFDKQLELLEERVQLNLDNISKEKSRKMCSTTSLRFEEANASSGSDESIQCVQEKQKLLFSQRLAQIISANQHAAHGRRSQSKNLLELKTNLISQNSLLPSKFVVNESSPRELTFKRNLSLPFKQCKQNFQRRTRNESEHAEKPNETLFYNNQYKKNNQLVKCYDSNEDLTQVKQAREVTNSMARIVKLTKNDEQNKFEVSAVSAFKPVRKQMSANCLLVEQAANKETSMGGYEQIKINRHFKVHKPAAATSDYRRFSSVFYNFDEKEFDSYRVNNNNSIPAPRLSDSHLLFKLKKEKKPYNPTYQKHGFKRSETELFANQQPKCFHSKLSGMSRQSSKNSFLIETEV